MFVLVAVRPCKTKSESGDDGRGSQLDGHLHGGPPETEQAAPQEIICNLPEGPHQGARRGPGRVRTGRAREHPQRPGMMRGDPQGGQWNCTGRLTCSQSCRCRHSLGANWSLVKLKQLGAQRGTGWGWHPKASGAGRGGGAGLACRRPPPGLEPGVSPDH